MMEPELWKQAVAHWPWLNAVLFYYTAWTLLLKLFNQRLQAWGAKVLAGCEGDPDKEQRMHSILESKRYRALAFWLNFLSIKLPTDEDFDRQLEAKREQ